MSIKELKSQDFLSQLPFSTSHNSIYQKKKKFILIFMIYAYWHI